MLNNEKHITIYAHIPFCVRKCPYCDFYSLPASSMSQTEINEYAILLSRELRLLKKRFPDMFKRKLLSIYFGGGTPSLIPPASYEPLFEEIRNTWPDLSEAEITLEANPETIDKEKLDGYIDRGVNRISLGVQSFSDMFLKDLGRIHNAKKSLETISLIKSEKRLRSFSIDLMFALHNQTYEVWEETLEIALAAYPPHISVYGLTIHPETVYYERLQKGELHLPSEEIQIKMFRQTREILNGSGYDHYEISNYAHPGHRSIHNLNYWKGNEYLGIGAGAHSFINDVHYFIPDNFGLYRQQIMNSNLPLVEDKYSSKEALLKEKIMLYIRMIDGIDIGEFNKKYECDLLKDFSKQIKTLLHLGLIDISNGMLMLTEDGLLLADEVTSYFF